MENFNELFDEKFFRSFKYNNEYIEIFTNPTRSELLSISSWESLKGVRALLNYKNDEIFVWDGNSAFHLDVAEKYLKDNINNYIPIEIYKDKSVYITGTSNLIPLDIKQKFNYYLKESSSLKKIISYL